MDQRTSSARTLRLSAAQAWMLLAHAGAHNDLCPLGERPSAPLTTEDLTILQTAGLLDAGGLPVGDWKEAARIVAAPQMEILAITGAADGVTHLRAYASPGATTKLAAVGARGEGEYTMAWPLERDDLLALFLAALGLDVQIADPGVRLDLSADAFLVLGAALDAMREAELDAMLARARATAPALDPAKIGLALRAGMVTDDARWLTPAFRRLLPRPPAGDDATMERGLSDLVSLGLLAPAGDARKFAPAPALEPVRRNLQAPLAWASLTAVAVTREGGRHWSGIGALRTWGALWGVETSGDQVRFVTTDETRFLEGVRAVLDAASAIATHAPPLPQAAAYVAPRYCGKCGARLQAGAKFCGGCGQALS